MDSKKRNTNAYFEDLIDLYRTHKAKISYDVIIAADNAAYNFLAENRDTLFPKVPVFYCGVNFIDTIQLSQLEGFYGFEERADHKGTIEVLQTLFPKRKKLLIINDNTITGKQIRSELEEVLPRLSKEISYEYYTSFSIDELKAKVSGLSDDYAIYLLVINKDKYGNFVSYKDGIRILKENSSVPIIGSWDFYVNKGIIGGAITSGGTQGREIASMAIQFIQNPKFKPANHSWCESDYLIDYRQLVKYGVSDTPLPENYRVINAPKRFQFDVAFLSKVILALLASLVIALGVIVFKRVQTNRLQSLVNQRTKELQERNEELKISNDRKNEVLGVVAHDLRNPIGNIYGLSTVIREEDEAKHILNPRLSKYLSLVTELSESTLLLVNDLLDVSVIESGIVKLNTDCIDYVSFLEKEVSKNELLAGSKNIKLIFNSSEKEIPLCFDKVKMQQVFINLLSNAIKFSEEGGKIDIRVKIKEAIVFTHIKDYGSGIPVEKLDTIFTRYEQLNKVNTEGLKGAGLGLTIAKGIIHAHEGKIYAESTIGEGATFTYELPLKQA